MVLKEQKVVMRIPAWRRWLGGLSSEYIRMSMKRAKEMYFAREDYW